MTDLLQNSSLVYHSPIFEAWKVPLRPVEVSNGVKRDLAAYQTAVETWTQSSGMCTYTGQHSRLSGMLTLAFAGLLYLSKL